MRHWHVIDGTVNNEVAVVVQQGDPALSTSTVPFARRAGAEPHLATVTRAQRRTAVSQNARASGAAARPEAPVSATRVRHEQVCGSLLHGMDEALPTEEVWRARKR